MPPNVPNQPGQDGHFPPTLWTMVLNPGDPPALERLCTMYRHPVLCLIRRYVRDRESAEDLTQDFFTGLIEKGSLTSVKPGLGRFRSWLRASVRNFLNNQWDIQITIKRGGNISLLPLDSSLDRPGPALTPDKQFDRDWATLMIKRAISRLRKECSTTGKLEVFDRLRPFLTDQSPDKRLKQVARELNKSQGALYTELSRLRKRLGKLLLHAVAQTVDCQDDMEDEVHQLFAAFE
jgi:RNA polymerase sigma-70 factor (ECF subfamily)